MKLKLMILGCARHGKDTVAEILRDNLGVTFQSSSFAAAEKVMVPYFAAKGITYASLDECYVDRVNHREEWFHQIRAYNTPDLTRLAREIYATNDVYVGMRNAEELEAVKAAKMFDYSIWVDRSKHIAPEPVFSNSIRPEMANYILDNNGTLKELKTKTIALYWDLVSLEYAGSLNP